MIFSANMFGLGFDSRHFHKVQLMRNRTGYRLISDRCIHLLGVTGFDSMIMVKGGNSGQLNGKTVDMYPTQRKAA